VHIGENTHTAHENIGVIIVNRLVSLAVQEGRVECIGRLHRGLAGAAGIPRMFYHYAVQLLHTYSHTTNVELVEERDQQAVTKAAISKGNYVSSSVITNKE